MRRIDHTGTDSSLQTRRHTDRSHKRTAFHHTLASQSAQSAQRSTFQAENVSQGVRERFGAYPDLLALAEQKPIINKVLQSYISLIEHGGSDSYRLPDEATLAAKIMANADAIGQGVALREATGNYDFRGDNSVSVKGIIHAFHASGSVIARLEPVFQQNIAEHIYTMAIATGTDAAMFCGMYGAECSLGSPDNTRSIRNRNLGNMKLVVPGFQDTDRDGFANFATWEDGITGHFQYICGLNEAREMYLSRGLNTIDQIYPTYAPPYDNPVVGPEKLARNAKIIADRIRSYTPFETHVV